MSGMVVMPLELDVFGNELSDKLDPFEMSPNRTFSEDVPTRSPRSPVGPAATISVEMRAELDAEGAELWNQASNRAESIITKWFSDVRGMTDEKKEWLRKVPTRHALAFCSSLAPEADLSLPSCVAGGGRDAQGGDDLSGRAQRV